ncbi:hypothetical protein GE061_019269 [Apolygus lucorum]|uniref:Uncharacterized protein n=1 Tax=Apolygus lucorum TaxID=248454 RepID=A0A6A4JW06_APOLU|nr:hypothetical protein GE061_019269 [Apolygus lucorum]
MSQVSPKIENEVLQAVKQLQKRKGVTTRKLIKYLVTSCGYSREKELLSSVRKVLKRSVRRGEAQVEGHRYKMVPRKDWKESILCRCRARPKRGERQETGQKQDATKEAPVATTANA